MNAVTLLGLAAAFCTSVSFVPQVIQILRSRNVQGISILMYSVFTIGVGLWLTYGLLNQDLAIIVANLVTFVLALTVLSLTIHIRIKERVMARRQP